MEPLKQLPSLTDSHLYLNYNSCHPSHESKYSERTVHQNSMNMSREK